MKKALGFLITALLPTAASSADLCKAIALRDVPALESPDTILQRGEYDEAITQYRVNKHTGMTSFCSHGGYCYPTHVQVSGKRVEALRLTNCKIGKRDDFDDDEEVLYSVDVVRSKNTAKALRLNDLEDRFLQIGLCSACAGNVATFYIKKPSSACSKLAKQALEGNPVATGKLVEFPGFVNGERNRKRDVFVFQPAKRTLEFNLSKAMNTMNIETLLVAIPASAWFGIAAATPPNLPSETQPQPGRVRIVHLT